jgi:MinD-like ATPase involved in chromosome partitioning or flagellar assembly
VARLALAVEPGLEAALAAQAVRHGHEVVLSAASAWELERGIPSLRPEAAIVGAGPRTLTPELLAACDEHGVRLVVLAGDESDRRRAAAIGLLETVDATAPWDELEPRILGASVTTTAEAPRERGTTIAVWGPSGAPGRTTIAVTLASELAAAGLTVALGDVDTHGAAIAPTLGLLDEAPGFAAACRLAGSGSLDRVELERIGERYSSPAGSFWVLTGIGRPSRWPELSADKVAGVIRECRDWVDVTVLDVSSSLEVDEEISSDVFAPRRNAATIAALREADHVVAVGSADPVGMSRFLRAYAELIETVSTHSVTVVMNRLRASAIGLAPATQVAQTLARFGGIEHPVMVPYDRPAFDAALLAGRAVGDVSPRSAARIALRDLAWSRWAPEAAVPVKRPLVERAFRGRRERAKPSG